MPRDRKRRRGGGLGASEAELAALVFGAAPGAPLLEPSAEAAGGGDGEIRNDAGERAATGSRDGAPAWVDEADADEEVALAGVSRLRKLREREDEDVVGGAEYEQRLRQQHRRIYGEAKWARPDRARPGEGGGEADEGDGAGHMAAVVRRAGGVLADAAGKRAGALPPGRLEVTRLRDANAAEAGDAVLRSLQFHTSGALLMTAGMDKTLRLFKVDGASNPKLQGVFFEDLPITQAAFAGTSHVVCAGRRPFFYRYDLQAAKVERVGPVAGLSERSLESFALSPDGKTMATLGKSGVVNLLNLGTRSLAASLRMSGTARTLAFSADGRRVMASGGDGAVLTWDLRTRRCLSRAADEACTGATALAASPDGAHYATGSDAGVVNLYADPHAPGGAGAPAPPLKAFMNLTTQVDTLAFSADGDILACASRMKKDALRLVHVPTRTVFANWPTARSPLQFVHCAAFSPGGAYLAVGNARGRALLYRLHHYDTA